MLKIGDQAPKFEFEDQTGKKSKFPDDFAGKWVGLFVLRSISCPICMEKLAEINQNQQKYRDAGVVPLVVVQSTARRVKGYTDKRKITVSVIPDHARNIYSLYDVAIGGLAAFMAPPVMAASLRATFKGYMHGLPEGSELQKPAGFIVDPQGKIGFVDYGKHIADMTSEDKFFMALNQLKGVK